MSSFEPKQIRCRGGSKIPNAPESNTLAASFMRLALRRGRGQVAWRRGKQAGMGYRAVEIICSPGGGCVSDRGVCREALEVCSPRRSGAAGRAGSRQR